VTAPARGPQPRNGEDRSKPTQPGALALAYLKSKPATDGSAAYSILDICALMAENGSLRDAVAAGMEAQRKWVVERDALQAHAEALAGAVDDALKILWHSETKGRPDLPNADRWRVVARLRDAIADIRPKVPHARAALSAWHAREGGGK
jgi:hypothetical protein